MDGMDAENDHAKAEKVVEYATDLKVPQLITASEIVNGNEQLLTLFLAFLFK